MYLFAIPCLYIYLFIYIFIWLINVYLFIHFWSVSDSYKKHVLLLCTNNLSQSWDYVTIVAFAQIGERFTHLMFTFTAATMTDWG